MFFSLGWLGFLILRLHTAGFEKCFILVGWGFMNLRYSQKNIARFIPGKKTFFLRKFFLNWYSTLSQPKESINLRSQLSSPSISTCCGWVEIMLQLSEVLLLVVQKSGDHQLRLVVLSYPMIYKILYISGGCLGRLPSTVGITNYSFRGSDLDEEFHSSPHSEGHRRTQQPKALTGMPPRKNATLNCFVQNMVWNRNKTSTM